LGKIKKESKKNCGLLQSPEKTFRPFVILLKYFIIKLILPSNIKKPQTPQSKESRPARSNSLKTQN